MYNVIVRAKWRPGKNLKDFMEWFEEYKDEQKRWGVLSARIFHSWFGGTHHLTCIYEVESIDRWSAGQDTAEGLKAIFAVAEVVDTNTLQFEVVKEVPIDF